MEIFVCSFYFGKKLFVFGFQLLVSFKFFFFFLRSFFVFYWELYLLVPSFQFLMNTVLGRFKFESTSSYFSIFVSVFWIHFFKMFWNEFWPSCWYPYGCVGVRGCVDDWHAFVRQENFKHAPSSGRFKSATRRQTPRIHWLASPDLRSAVQRSERACALETPPRVVVARFIPVRHTSRRPWDWWVAFPRLTGGTS